jgi:catechol 2,3-dioxygenase-like lactoylglutathione lyase family enzyme
MLKVIDDTLDDLEQRRIGRREAVARIATLAAALAGGASIARAEDAEPAATFKAQGLNHIALRVTDLERSRDFYVKHLGMRVTSESQWSCFLDCGGGHFLALFKSERAEMDHYCYTISDYNADDVVKRLKAAGLEPRRQDNRVYFDDPDGLEVQLAAR